MNSDTPPPVPSPLDTPHDPESLHDITLEGLAVFELADVPRVLAADAPAKKPRKSKHTTGASPQHIIMENTPATPAITLAQAQAAETNIKAARAAIAEAEELILKFNHQHVREKHGFGVGDIIQHMNHRGGVDCGMVYGLKFWPGELAPKQFTVEIHPLNKNGTVGRLRWSFSFSDYSGGAKTEVKLITPATPAI